MALKNAQVNTKNRLSFHLPQNKQKYANNSVREIHGNGFKVYDQNISQ